MLMNMAQLLKVAQKHSFGIPAFNISSSMLVRAVLEASEEKKAPVIIEIHPDELDFVGNDFMKYVIEAAKNASFPVCIHLDHGSSFEQVMRAIRTGFTSVMIDSSLTSFEDNVAITQKVVEAAHNVGVSVEAELGTIGAIDAYGEKGVSEITYTRPEDVAQFVKETNVDTLAIAIGTAHGLYPKGQVPKLRLDILKEITNVTDVPLVLHGGSGNSDSEISEAIKLGVCKINISSDIKSAFYDKCREVLEDKNLRESADIYSTCIKATKDVIFQKFDVFNTNNKAQYYK